MTTEEKVDLHKEPRLSGKEEIKLSQPISLLFEVRDTWKDRSQWSLIGKGLTGLLKPKRAIQNPHNSQEGGCLSTEAAQDQVSTAPLVGAGSKSNTRRTCSAPYLAGPGGSPRPTTEPLRASVSPILKLE